MKRCFRQDLVITEDTEALEEGGQRRFLVSDPHTGELFELGEEETFLCRLLDGIHTAPQLRQAFFERFGMELDDEGLEAFIEQMEGFGFLEPCDERPRAGDAARSPMPVASPDQPSPPDTEDGGGSGPYRWTLFNPHTVLDRLGRWLGPLGWTVWLLLPGIPLSLLTLLHHDDRVQAELDALAAAPEAGLGALLFKVLFSLFFINLTSKLAQGIVAARQGAAMEGFGLRLAFGVIPRFFIDKRPIWRLHRSGQLRSFAAPLLMKLALFVAGTLTWAWSSQGVTQIGSIALMLGQIALGAFLFTANPLWKADGYAWLTTYFRLPRLRERAFGLLRLRLGGREAPQALGEGEGYALLGYALATVAFVVLFIGTILVSLGATLEQRYSGTGVVLFLVFLGLFVSWAMAMLARRTRRSEEAVAVRRKARPRSRTGWLWLLLIAAAGMLPYPYETGGTVTIYPAIQAEARARSDGGIGKVLVTEGDWVEAGQLLAVQDDWGPAHELRLAHRELEKKRAELALLLQGPKPEAIRQAREELTVARVRAEHSARQRQLLEPGLKDGTVPALDFEKALSAEAVDRAAVGVAEANVSLVRSPPQAQEVAIKEAEIAQLEERVAYLDAQLQRTRITAPAAGRVASARLEQKLGTFLREGDLFSVVEDTRAVQAEILVPETDLGEVAPGAATEVKLWGYPQRDFIGRVDAIGSRVEASPDSPFVSVVRITTRLENPDGLIKSEMTGYAKVSCREMPAALAFTRMLVRFFLIEVWSWLP